MGKVLFVTRNDGMIKSIDKKISDVIDCEFVSFTSNDLIDLMKNGGYTMVVLYITRLAADEDIVLSKILAFSSGIPLVIVGGKDELHRCFLKGCKDVVKYIKTPIHLSDYIREINHTLKKIEIMNGVIRGDEVEIQEIDSNISENDNELKKILLVDDDPFVLRTISSWLKEFFSISVAKSGAEAIKILFQQPVDLILMDYDMPGCDGVQTVKMIRAEEQFSKIPVFFLTGVDDSDMVKKAIEVNPQGYILKSNGPSYLVSKIEKFF